MSGISALMQASAPPSGGELTIASVPKSSRLAPRRNRSSLLAQVLAQMLAQMLAKVLAQVLAQVAILDGKGHRMK